MRVFGYPLAQVLGGAGFGQGGSGSSLLPLQIDFSTLPNGALPATLNGPTWTIASGKAINTPTEGAEKLTDPGLEAWTSATNLTSYTETIAGTSTVNQDTVEMHGGANCARLDISAANDNAHIQQAPSVALHDWLIFRSWVKASTTSKTHQTNLVNQYPENSNAQVSPTTYAQFVHTAVVRQSAGWFARIGRTTGTSASLYFDDLSLKKLTTADLPATLNAGVADVTVKGNWTTPQGVVVGVIMNLDSVSNPQNYVLLIINGHLQYLQLLKCVAGTVTQVVLPTITYVAGASVELRKTGTTYKCFYNGVQAGVDQTISDVGIISNTIHGLISTHSSGQCSFFSAAAA